MIFVVAWLGCSTAESTRASADFELLINLTHLSFLSTGHLFERGTGKTRGQRFLLSLEYKS